jgi:hypothetical protein
MQEIANSVLCFVKMNERSQEMPHKNEALIQREEVLFMRTEQARANALQYFRSASFTLSS